MGVRVPPLPRWRYYMSFEIIEISKTEKQAKFNINEKEVSDGFMELLSCIKKMQMKKDLEKGKFH